MPHSQFRNVVQFMETFNQPVPKFPTIPAPKVEELRLKLNLEETFELAEAMGFEIRSAITGEVIARNADLVFKKVRETNVVGVIDAFTDTDYTNLGGIASYGFDAEPLQKEVHRSNMSKLWSANEVATQKPANWHAHETDSTEEKRFIVITDTGKVAKSPSYKPANFEQFVPKKVQAELF